MRSKSAAGRERYGVLFIYAGFSTGVSVWRIVSAGYGTELPVTLSWSMRLLWRADVTRAITWVSTWISRLMRNGLKPWE